jgi:hypothetical protein
MMLAGHLPTKQFSLADWQSMRVFEPKKPWDFPGDGFYRTRVKGKPVVGYCAPVGSGDVSFAVRPVVRVPMGRRVLSMSQMILADWWLGRATVT